MNKHASAVQWDPSPNNLEPFWLGFTPNRAFKKRPRLIARAKDMHYYDMTGRPVLDATAGLWCSNAGHCRDPIVAAIQKQAAELDFAPTQNFRFDMSLGFLDSGFDSITPPPPFGPVTPTATATLNSSLPFTPERQGHLGASYSFGLGSEWRLTPRVDVSYTSSQYFDAGNSVEIAQTDDVTLVNLSVVLATNDERWRLMLSGFNLSDEMYPIAGTSSLTTASGYAEIIHSRPRNWSFSATRSF